MTTMPKYIRVNVHNLPLGILQTTYYAHSAELLNDTLVVDIRLDPATYVTSEVPMTLGHPATTKFDLAPIRRPINVRVLPSSSFPSENMINLEETNDTELFAPIREVVLDTPPARLIVSPDTLPARLIVSPDIDDDETVSTIDASDERYVNLEVTSVRTGRKNRFKGNRDSHWISKRRKVRKDKGELKGIECPLCCKGRMILHQCCKCFNSFCLDCFDKLLKHQYDMNVCNVCKSSF